MYSLDREAIQRFWRDRCLETRRQFDLALLLRVLVESADEADPGIYRMSLNGEASATKEYSRVLKLYTDLLVHGRIPAEIPSKPKGAAAR